jgi:hypothetical protein
VAKQFEDSFAGEIHCGESGSFRLGDNLVCRFCRRAKTLELCFPSVGVATIPKLTCSKCGWDSRAAMATTTIRADGAKRNAVIDYDTDVKCGLAFVSSGDGGTKAQRFLSFMSLPNAASLEKSYLPKIEAAMTESIQSLADKYLCENLIKEVQLTYGGDHAFNYNGWKDALEGGNDINETRPSVAVGMDMGWQKRSSGRKYDSNSGHAFLIGVKTCKPIA